MYHLQVMDTTLHPTQGSSFTDAVTRFRRVKCDETKPECMKCLNSKRVCDGYLSSEQNMPRRQLAETVRHLAVIGPVARALSQSPLSANPFPWPVSPDDAVFFNLFRHATVPSTSSVFPSHFWKRNVMQLAHSESAIWHATVALGTLHQRSETLALHKHDEEQRLSRRAEAHYGKAMALAKDLDSPAKIATLSVVLVAAASMLSRWSEMQTHVLAGLRIIAQDHSRSSTIQILQGSLMKIDLQAMTFSESSSPYPYDQAFAAYNADHFLTTPIVQELTYETLSSELFGLCRTYFLLDDTLLSGTLTYRP